jgi:uncharacterized protein YaaW (UPF0174 family)
MPAYRQDPDLEFLRVASDSDLDPLVEILCGKPDDRRLTEGLTGSDAYKTHAPQHHVYWDKIAAELQTFGGNGIANLMRGDKGVLYREILCNVCDKMKVNYNPKQDIAVIEGGLLMKLLETSMEKMTDAELRQTAADLKLKTTNFTKQGVLAAIQGGMLAGGFLTYQISVIVANAVVKAVVGRGLTIAGNAALTRAVGVFLGPIGWAITIAWTVIDITGPAYRVTIPACVYVAYLRQKQLAGAGS